MARKKKLTKPAREWIGNWTVVYDWKWNGQLLTSRQFDFRVAEEVKRRTTTWFQFNRHVTNHDNDKVWVDGFDPAGGFVSYRPEDIIAVRPHREVKKDVSNPGPSNRGRKPRR